ncbi:MAG: B12-binding domain-containing radical SAM protein [Bacteroidota bacterium]
MIPSHSILLTHGYFLQEDETEKRIMKPYPTLGILYISAYLKSKGFSVDIFDSTFQTKQEFRSYIDTHRPSLVGIYVNLMTKLNALDLIAYCKSKGCTVIVGGPEVPFYGEDFIKHGADIGVIGEGELTLEEVIPHVQKHSPHGMSHINGIIYRESNGEIIRTAERELIADLDLLPHPDRSAIDMNRYVETWRTHHKLGSVSLICARGCPFTCTWCSRSVFGDTHRRRSAKNVVDEIEMLLAEYTPDMLWFADDVFTINHRWFYAFYEEMKKRNIRIPFECISRADRLNEDILQKMAELGSFRIWFGSESGSQRILDAMQRRVSVEQIRKITGLAQKYGIQAGLFVMLGYPGEEISDIDATITHLKETNPDTYLTTLAYPIKGTTMYNEVKDHLIVNDSWEKITDRTLNFSGRHSERFYWFATRHLVNEIALHKMMSNGRRNLGSVVSTFAKAKIARVGMQLTRSTRT